MRGFRAARGGAARRARAFFAFWYTNWYSSLAFSLLGFLISIEKNAYGKLLVAGLY